MGKYLKKKKIVMSLQFFQDSKLIGIAVANGYVIRFIWNATMRFICSLIGFNLLAVV